MDELARFFGLERRLLERLSTRIEHLALGTAFFDEGYRERFNSNFLLAEGPLDDVPAEMLLGVTDRVLDEAGFRLAMDEHRLKSGGGEAMGRMGGEDAEFYAGLLKSLQKKGKLGPHGVEYDPYTSLRAEGEVLALVVDGLLGGIERAVRR